ncbi:hypothetical protein LC164_09575, partial [Escherichia coli]
GAGRTSDGNGSHASTLKSPSYTKSVSWQHYPMMIVAECNYYCLSALYIVCNKPGLKILINDYRKSL